jgi:hypothetical protein
MPSGVTIAYRLEITSLAAGHRLPAVYHYRSFAEVGGLLSYGVQLADNFRRAATYCRSHPRARNRASFPWTRHTFRQFGKPVQAPVKFELVSRPALVSFYSCTRNQISRRLNAPSWAPLSSLSAIIGRSRLRGRRGKTV